MNVLSHQPCRIKYENIHELCNRYPGIFCVLTRSCNQNVIVYEVNFDRKYNVCKQKPVKAYWLDLDKNLQKIRRKKGISHDFEELSYIEEKYAYGVSTKFLAPDKLKVCFSIPNMSCTVLIKNKKAFAYHQQKIFNKAYCIIKSSSIQWSLKKMIKSVTLFYTDGSKKSIF